VLKAHHPVRDDGKIGERRKEAHRATWQPIQSGSACVQRASAQVKLEAPSAATKICARRTSPVTASMTSTVCPA
jgi:hypothetical protein